jgi:hypothetical protein
MSPDSRATLNELTTRLGAALRRDAAALEGDGAPDLARLADALDALLAVVARHPENAAARAAVIEALSEVEAFHARVRTAHASVREALLGAAERRVAGRAYGEARRFGLGGDAA